MSLKTQLPTDVMNVFLATNAFAEAISYIKASGASRSINAIIERDSYGVLREMVGVERPSFRVIVANHATSGILPGELNTATDRLTFPDVEGGTVTTYKIDRILDQDPGALSLEVH